MPNLWDLLRGGRAADEGHRHPEIERKVEQAEQDLEAFKLELDVEVGQRRSAYDAGGY